MEIVTKKQVTEPTQEDRDERMPVMEIQEGEVPFPLEDGGLPAISYDAKEDQEAEWDRWQREREMAHYPQTTAYMQEEEMVTEPSCRVRFLHSAAGFGPVDAAVGDMTLNSLEFGQMSEFITVPVGYNMTLLSSCRMPGLILFQKTLLYPAGSVLTAVIYNDHDGPAIKLVPEV